MTWAKRTMPDGVLSSIECIQHSMRLRLVETSLELAYGTGEWTIRLAEFATSVVRVDAAPEFATSVVGVDAAPEMRELALAKLQDARKTMSSCGLTISSAGSQIRTKTYGLGPTCLARPGTPHAEPVRKQDIRP